MCSEEIFDRQPYSTDHLTAPHYWGVPILFSPASCSRAVAPYATAKGSETAPAAQTVTEDKKSPPTTSRMAEAPGMAPSAEMRLFREARESAKAAAAANGSGRRARAPSRKALEALGKMSSEGAQWMTREKREEQERQKREMKEKRRAAAAAGLKAGHVIEAFAVATAGDVGGGGGGVGIKNRGVGNRGGETIQSNPLTGNLVSAERQQAAGRQPADEGFCSTTHDSNVTTEAKAGFSGRAREITPVAVVEANKEPSKKRKQAEAKADRDHASGVDSGKNKKRRKKAKAVSEGGSKVHTEQAPNKEVKQRSGRKGKQTVGGRTSGREAARSTILCDFQSCPKPAMYGVNDTVRYW